MISVLLASNRLESAAQLMTVLVIFIFVLVLTYLTTRFVGKYQGMQGYNKNFEAIETFRITNNKFLQLVRVGKKYLVISIGKDEVNLVMEISEDDIDLSAGVADNSDAFKRMLDIAKEKIVKRGDKND